MHSSRRRWSIFWLLVVAAGSPQTVGDQWQAAREVEVRSSQERFAARIVPGDDWGAQVGFAGAERGRPATAAVTDLETELSHTFELLNPVAPVEVVLLDDGSLLTVDNWHNAGFGEVLVLYDAQGKVVWHHRLEDLFSEEILQRIPRSVSSRWWRKSPLEWELRSGPEGGRTGFLALWNEDRLAIDLRDGSTRLVPTADPGDHPEALLRQAQDLEKRGEIKKAEANLRRALALDPTYLDGYLTLAGLYRQQERHESAVSLLLSAREVFPVSSRDQEPSSAYGSLTDRRVWIWIELARAYEAQGKAEEAEGVYRETLELGPENWLAAKGYVYLLLDQKRDREALHLLDQFFELKRGDPSAYSADHRLVAAAHEIGQLLRYQNRFPEARSYLARGYGIEPFNSPLADDYGAVLEALEEDRQALAVYRDLLQWAVGSKDRWAKDRAEKAIARIEERLAGELQED